MTERDALMCLNAVPGVGAVTMAKLLEFFENAQGIFEAVKEKDALNGILKGSVFQSFERFSSEGFLKSECGLLQEQGASVLIQSDKEFPPLLKEIPAAPQVLYVRGSKDALKSLSVSIIGARRCSVYGLSVAEELAGHCAELGIAVVSGLARGIDTAAHRGALKAGGVTVAVLGNGLSRVYPPENESLAKQIVESNGAVVSEFPMETSPHAGNFPRRNRIVSGLSLGTVVVEAAARSGALITVGYALEQGREVFAVPGSIHRRTSEGTHHLIKQGAKVVCGIEDILEELAPHIKGRLAKKEDGCATREKSLSEDERSVLNCLSDEPVHFEELVSFIKKAPADIMVSISKLECGRLIQRVNGNFFVRSNNVLNLK